MKKINILNYFYKSVVILEDAKDVCALVTQSALDKVALSLPLWVSFKKHFLKVLAKLKRDIILAWKMSVEILMLIVFSSLFSSQIFSFRQWLVMQTPQSAISPGWKKACPPKNHCIRLARIWCFVYKHTKDTHCFYFTWHFVPNHLLSNIKIQHCIQRQYQYCFLACVCARQVMSVLLVLFGWN